MNLRSINLASGASRVGGSAVPVTQVTRVSSQSLESEEKSPALRKPKNKISQAYSIFYEAGLSPYGATGHRGKVTNMEEVELEFSELLAFSA